MLASLSVVERDIHLPVPPDRAFAYWLEPALLVRWMGDRAQIDARPGGSWRLEYGDRYVAAGEILELDPPRRLVISWGWEKGDPASIPAGSSRVAVTFEPDGDGTRMRLVHELPEEAVAGHTEGWDFFLPRLVTAAAPAAPTAPTAPAMEPPGGGARAVADLARGNALATVWLAAAPERVFRALVSDEITAWWVRPGVFDTREWHANVSPGGEWHAAGMGACGPYGLEGEFVEIDPPRRLVHTWRLAGTPGGATTVTYELDEHDGGTWLTLRHEGFLTRDAALNTTIGWETSFGRLGELLAGEVRDGEAR